MITIKYSKTGNAVFISHIDLLRNMVRIIRRAKLNVNFSKGFNPHMLLFFSPPLALGINSVAEYMTVDIDDISPEEFLKKFNSVACQGIQGLTAYYTKKSPNLAGQIVKADYYFPINDCDDRDKLIKYFTDCKSFEICFRQKGKDIKKEVSNQIISVNCYEDGILFGLATGNNNLRADRFAVAINHNFDMDIKILDIQKLKQFIKVDDTFIDAQKFLSTGGNLEKIIY